MAFFELLFNFVINLVKQSLFLGQFLMFRHAAAPLMSKEWDLAE